MPAALLNTHVVSNRKYAPFCASYGSKKRPREDPACPVGDNAETGSIYGLAGLESLSYPCQGRLGWPLVRIIQASLDEGLTPFAISTKQWLLGVERIF
jgi:hypothetical protein